MKKILALSLALLMCLGCFSVSYAEEKPTLKVWFAEVLYSNIYTSADEAPLFKAIEEKTGIDIEWVEPAAGADVATAYNLMMNSKELPDVIWSSDISSNALSHLNNGVIIDLAPYLNAETMPNVTALYEANPTYALACKTDDGRVFGTVSVAEYECWQGPWVNMDWLEACGLDVPETIDDWDEMLRAFKDEFGGALSIVNLQGNIFLGAYGFPKLANNLGFYQEDGVVKYTPQQEGYKQYLELMAGWYADGLLDPDFASNTNDILVNKAANNEIGAFEGFQVSGAQVASAQKLYGTTGNWKAVAYPRLEDGDKVAGEMGIDTLAAATAITSSCEDIDTAVRFLDWMYSDEAITLFNFGIEGESYYIDENGNPQYTETFLTGPEGMVEYALRYTGIVGNVPNVKSFAASFARNDPASNEAETIWKADWTNAEWAQVVLPVLGATEEENAITNSIVSALTTKIVEAQYEFITGARNLDEDWDAFQAELEEIGIDAVLEIRQAQLDRVNNR